MRTFNILASLLFALIGSQAVLALPIEQAFAVRAGDLSDDIKAADIPKAVKARAVPELRKSADLSKRITLPDDAGLKQNVVSAPPSTAAVTARSLDEPHSSSIEARVSSSDEEADSSSELKRGQDGNTKSIEKRQSWGQAADSIGNPLANFYRTGTSGTVPPTHKQYSQASQAHRDHVASIHGRFCQNIRNQATSQCKQINGRWYNMSPLPK